MLLSVPRQTDKGVRDVVRGVAICAVIGVFGGVVEGVVGGVVVPTATAACTEYT